MEANFRERMTTHKGEKVALLNPGGGYSYVVDRILLSIARHLPDFTLQMRPHDGAFNVHLFREIVDVTTNTRRQHPDMYISHGWNQKPIGNWFDQTNAFSHIGVPGPMVRDFLLEKGIPESKIHIVGHPGMDTVLNGMVPKEIHTEKPILVVALSLSSYIGQWQDISECFPADIKRDFMIVNIPHPVLGWRLARDVLQQASVCISDWSGTIFEAWSLGVPVVFPSWMKTKVITAPGSPIQVIYENQIGYHCQSEEKLEETIRQASAEGITQEENKFLDGYFPPELRGRSGDEAAKQIMTILEEGGV